MRKTRESTVSFPEKLLVTVPELAEYMGCGRFTANKTAAEAAATVFIGRRKLVNLEKVRKYLNSISE